MMMDFGMAMKRTHPWIIRLCEQVKCPPCYLFSHSTKKQTRRWGGRIGTRDLIHEWRHESSRKWNNTIKFLFFLFSCCGLRVPWKWKCMYFFFVQLLGNSNDEQVSQQQCLGPETKKKFLISFLYFKILVLYYFFCRNRKCNR